MAVEKMAFDLANPVEASRAALERSLTRLQEAFSSTPKSLIKKRIRKAKELTLSFTADTASSQ